MPFARLAGVSVALASITVAAAACAAGTTRGTGSVAHAASSSGRATGSAGSGPAATCGTQACFADPTGVSTVLAAATAGVVAANSYDYRHLAAARARALPLLAGSYRRQYVNAFDDVVTPAAKRLAVVQTARTDVTAITDLGAVSARVLVAGQLSVDERGVPPRINPFDASVHLTRSGTRWQIDSIDLDPQDEAAGLGSAALAAAVRAGTRETVNLLTYRRATFDADYARAVAGATGSLRTEIQAKKTTTRATLTKGHFDLTARIGGSGVVSISTDSVTLLVTVKGYRSSAASTPTPQVLQLTVQQQGTRWLASDVQSVAVR